MKKIIFILSILGVFVLGGFTQSVFAVNRTHALILTPSVGYYYFAHKRHLKDQVIGGLGIGYGFNDCLSAEVFFGHISSKQRRDERRDVSGMVTLIDGYYHFRTQTKLQPYVLAGVGAIYTHPHPDRDTSTQANINVGAGVAYYFSDQIALRADGRDIFTMAGGKHDFMLNVGVNFLLFGAAA